MYFQTAGIEVAIWIPPLVAFVVSFFTSMGGVSGAFLLLPFQMSFLNYTDPSVSATNQLYNIIAIPSGVYRYLKEGRMVWPLTWIVVVGTLPGVFIGAFVRIAYLPNPDNFKIFASFVLFYIGIKMVRDLVKKPVPGTSKNESDKRFQELMKQYRNKTVKQSIDGKDKLQAVRIIHFTLKNIRYEFYGDQFDIPIWQVFSLSFIVGIIGGIYGIGGGSIIAPFFVTFFGLPVYTVAGAALMGTFVTSIAGVFFYQLIAPFYPDLSIAPDYLLGSLFGLGGICGMYLGARFQKFVPASAIKWMLAAIIIFTASKYVFNFIF